MTEIETDKTNPSSFRDPSGFVFYRNGAVYRQINIIYKENYDHLLNSGLFNTLVRAELLIPHNEVEFEGVSNNNAYKVIKPELIPFISYPYEWCFSQLKNAALTTLEIQKKSLHAGMSLKDCSAYNIQFINGKPIFIDTLSFEKYREGQPWIAYRQFCQHFLAPLALMCHRDIRLNQLVRVYIDGVPLDLASSLLPFHTRFIFSMFSHIHLHSKSEKHFADKSVKLNGNKMSRRSFLGLIDNLEAAVKKLKWRPQGTTWATYYEDNNYSANALLRKKEVVSEFLDNINPTIVWDLGGNTGLFSRIASEKCKQTISFDMDPAAVEKNYLECLEKKETNILPLLLDLTNPSPNIGWENQERMSLIERGPADTVLALALIHHLAICNNLPFKRIANFFSTICKSLIIEFVPKSDSKVQKLLSTREDIFPHYTQQAFEDEFEKSFTIKDAVQIANSDRTLYLMLRRQS